MRPALIVFVDGRYAYACDASRAYAEGIEACAALLGASTRVSTYILPDDEEEMAVQQSAIEVAKAKERHG